MSSKTDILAFLDAKFNKIKPKKKKVAIKEPASDEPEKIIHTIAKLKAETPTCHVTQQSLYSELVSESEIQKLSKNQSSDTLGVKILKQHLKNENTFEKDVKDKIFFIGQNALKGQSIEQAPAPMAQQFKRTHRAKTKLSKNTMKTIERMQAQTQLKHETFQKLNGLWLQYISVLMQMRPQELTSGLSTKDCSVQNNLCSKLVKADFTGASVKVVNSKNLTLIGTEGIVVRESTRTFVVIQVDDQVKVLIKEGSVFQFILPSCFKETDGAPLAVNIWGDNILYRGSERTKIKFKEKYNLQLY